MYKRFNQCFLNTKQQKAQLEISQAVLYLRRSKIYQETLYTKKHFIQKDLLSDDKRSFTVLGRHSDSGICISHGFALRLRLKQKP